MATKKNGEKKSKYDLKPIDDRETRGREIVIANMANIYEWFKEGCTVTEVCKRMGIYRQVWYMSVKQIPELQRVIQEAKEAQIENVERSLVDKCFDREVEQEKVLSNGKKVKYKKVVAASDNLIKFFLINKDPQNWKEKQEVEIIKRNFNIQIIDTDDYIVVDAETEDADTGEAKE